MSQSHKLLGSMDAVFMGKELDGRYEPEILNVLGLTFFLIVIVQFSLLFIAHCKFLYCPAGWHW